VSAPKPVAVPAAKPSQPRQPSKPAPLPLSIPLPRAAGLSNKPAPTAKEALSAKAKAAAKDTKQRPAAAAARPEAEAPRVAFDAGDLAATWDDAPAAIERAGDRATALVEAWTAEPNAAAIARIAEEDDVPAPARKAARRALNVLRARGVPIPTRARVIKLDDDREQVAIEATLIPPDSHGTIALSIASRDKSGRYHVAEVILREPLGILQAGHGWLSGSQLKEARNRALEGLGVAPVLVRWSGRGIASPPRGG
jgi:hypothetical protein